ncbi:hypothetical protein BDV33DRAFT_230441 [Aspergillus novoparasiticus]|uniref:Uncharacterized protein n=1 Tax=Aspergillus novoparasiticus TaxID=986946 RepID=A0A5N6E8I1_9EURO|nr:hypothetical protein BDV33DRAFT_230441 [Aspergillus novoparasiticus]
MARTSHLTWKVTKKGLVSTGNFGDFCRVQFIRFAHNENANEGSISITIKAHIANQNNSPRKLTLSIPPKLVEKCEFARESNDGLFPARFIHNVPGGATNVSDVSTLSLELNEVGHLICPSGTEYVTPTNPGDTTFDAFTRICRSQSLRIHFAGAQFVNDQLDGLETFLNALGHLNAETFDHGRHHTVKKDWRAFFPLPNPPPYCEEPVSEQVAPPEYCTKRCRDSMPHDNDRQKKPRASSPQPMDSTTEPDTPSTLPPSPSIRPTHFTSAFSLTSLERKLKGLSDGEAREVFRRLGYEHLLAKPNDVDSDLPSEKVALGKVMLIKERDIEEYIDSIFKRYLPNIVDDIAERARDLISDECKANEAEFREHLEDGNSEVRIMADECIKEVEEAAQRYIHEMNDVAQQCMDDMQKKCIENEMSVTEKTAKSKYRFNASSRSSPGNARRSSI